MAFALSSRCLCWEACRAFHFVMVNPDTPLKVAVDPNVGTSCIIGALIIRIGFWGPLYDNYSQETPTIVWVIIEAPPIHLES